MLLLLAACRFDAFPMDTGMLDVRDEDLHVGVYSSLPAEGPVLAGSTFCAELSCPKCPDELDLDCWEQRGEGSVTVLPADCVEVDVGPGAWHFDYDPDCEEAWPEGSSDRARVTGVPLDDVSAGVEFPLRDMAGSLNEGTWVTPVGMASFPLDLAPEELRVLDGATPLDVVLTHPDHEGFVGFSEPELELSVEGAYDWELATPTRMWLLPLGEGEVAQLSATLRGRELPVATVTSVSPDEVSSLELVVGLYNEGLGPAGLVVDLRDAQGRPLLGGDVDLRGRGGDMVLVPERHMGWEDRQTWWFHDCRPPSERGGERSVEVRARYAGSSDEVTVSWVGQVDEGQTDEGFTPPEECPSCGCGNGGAPGAWAGLLLLGVLLRRQGSSESSPSSTE